MYTSNAQRTRIERVLAGLTILNGFLGLAVWLYRGYAGGLLLLSLLALLAGAMAWRGRPGGHLAALAVYGPQLASYYSYDLTHAYQLGGALSLGLVVQLPTGVLVINVFALAMFAASAALLWRRVRGGGKAYSTYQ
jgi:hypothetical protein